MPKLFPHICHVMNKYKSKIPRDDLKRFAKEVAKKLVESDFKSGRVENSTKISEKHAHKVKKYCKEFFEKAAYKHKKHEKEKAERVARKAVGFKSNGAGPSTPPTVAPSPPQNLETSPDLGVKEESGTDEDVKMSEDEFEDEEASPAETSTGLE